MKKLSPYNAKLLILLSFVFSIFISTISAQLQGGLDPAFNTYDNGYFGDGGGCNSHAHCVLIEPSGRIIVGGNFWDVNYSGHEGVTALTDDWSVSPSFTGSTVTGGSSSINTVVRQSDGKLILGGYFLNFG